MPRLRLLVGLLVFVVVTSVAHGASDAVTGLHPPRDLPRCLPENVGRDFGYDIGKTYGQLRLEYNNWYSSELLSILTVFLLRDVMQYDVSLQLGDLLYSTDRQHLFARLANRDVDINMEMWPAGKESFIQNYISDGDVDEAGVNAYVAQQGLFMLTATVDANADLAPEYWKSLKKEQVLALFAGAKRAAARTPAGDRYVCDSELESFCEDGLFTPPQCRDNPDACIEVNKGDPGWSNTNIEQIIVSLGFNMTMHYSNYSTWYNYIDEKAQNKEAFLSYLWRPSPLTSAHDFTIVVLPEYTVNCWQDNTFDPFNPKINCAYPTEITRRIAHKDVRQEAPEAFELMREMNADDGVIEGLMRGVYGGLSTYDAACNWLRNHTSLWQSWVPYKKSVLEATRELVEVAMPAESVTVSFTRSVSGVGAASVQVRVLSESTIEEALGVNITELLLDNERLAQAGVDFVAPAGPLTVSWTDAGPSVATAELTLLDGQPAAREAGLTVLLPLLVYQDAPDGTSAVGSRNVVRVLLRHARIQVQAGDASTNVAAIVAPVIVALLLIVAAVAYMQHTRKQVRKQMEENEENKFMLSKGDLEFGELIGSGTYGNVYKGEFRGTTVAIKRVSMKQLNASLSDMSGGTAAAAAHQQAPMAAAPMANAARTKQVAMTATRSQKLSGTIKASKMIRGADTSQMDAEDWLHVQSLVSEVHAMCTLRHPNLLLFIGATPPPDVCIVLEFMERGALSEIVVNMSVPLTEERKLKFLLDGARGMNYLHQATPKILHCDLKSPNLLVGADWNVKVADFGMTQGKDQVDTFGEEDIGEIGSLLWLPLEVWDGIEYTDKSEVHSFAVIMWEVMARKAPWVSLVHKVMRRGFILQQGDMQQDMDQIAVLRAILAAGLRLDHPPTTTQRVRSLIDECWHNDPAARPSFQDVCNTISRFLVTAQTDSAADRRTTAATENARLAALVGNFQFRLTRVGDAELLQQAHADDVFVAAASETGVVFTAQASGNGGDDGDGGDGEPSELQQRVQKGARLELTGKQVLSVCDDAKQGALWVASAVEGLVRIEGTGKNAIANLAVLATIFTNLQLLHAPDATSSESAGGASRS